MSFLAAGCTGYVSSTLPTLSLSSTTFNFSTVVIGQSASQTLNISNTGTAPLQITGLSVSNKAFSISGPSVPRVILPANSLSYTLAFAPTSPGNASASLTIASNASNASVAVSLAGSGEQAYANLSITPASINFGNLALKTTSTQNVTIQNTGDINLALQGITVAGAGFGYSNLSTGVSLSPNQQVTFQIWFSPSVAGPASATVSFLSPNLASPETMGLTGDGVTSTSTPAVQHTVHLTWGASSSAVIGYNVYRRLASVTSYAPLSSTPINALSYDDSTVALGATYDYVVTAVDAAGVESVYSNPATAVIPSS